MWANPDPGRLFRLGTTVWTVPKHRIRVRCLAVLAAVLVIALGFPGPAHAASSTAGDATPNFNESAGCGTYGLRGPLGPTMTLGDRIYGPYADYFGRSRTQVFNSLSTWAEPWTGRTLRVHPRAVAAFTNAVQRINAASTGYVVRSVGTYNWRNIANTFQMSHHALAKAIDINPATNPVTNGPLITDMPPAFVQAWRDAGFCWGGDYVFGKDAMHYGWIGPAFASGKTTRLTPFPALTGQANFTTMALDTTIAIPSADLYALSSKRRDGADDLYGLVAKDGKWEIHVAGAGDRFRSLGVRRATAVPTGGIPYLADHDGDGYADIWRFNTTGATITADIYYDSSRFMTKGATVTTGAVWSADADLGLAWFDTADWIPDLYVIRRNTGVVEVYSSASGYQQLVHTSTLSTAVGDAKIVLADRNLDGQTDIWLIDPGASVQARVALWSNGYGGAPQTFSPWMPVGPSDVVLPGDYDGDGRIDLYVVSGQKMSVWLGGVPDRPIADLGVWFTTPGPNTFDIGPPCVGVCDRIGYVDESGEWRLAHDVAWGTADTKFYYGTPGDVPLMGDWDCDGIDTPGLYRASTGFVYLRNSNSQGFAHRQYFFGVAGDVPLAGDFDGDGCDTVSIYRPSEQRFYIINRLGDGGVGLPADFSFIFGVPGDKPFTGDFDGNGRDEIGLHRESTGLVYLRYTLTTGFADTQFFYGLPGDFLVAGDWDGNGTDTPAIYRPSEGNWYFRLANTQGFANHVIGFGAANRAFRPVSGHHGQSTPITGPTQAIITDFEPD